MHRALRSGKNLSTRPLQRLLATEATPGSPAGTAISMRRSPSAMNEVPVSTIICNRDAFRRARRSVNERVVVHPNALVPNILRCRAYAIHLNSTPLSGRSTPQASSSAGSVSKRNVKASKRAREPSFHSAAGRRRGRTVAVSCPVNAGCHQLASYIELEFSRGLRCYPVCEITARRSSAQGTQCTSRRIVSSRLRTNAVTGSCYRTF